MRVVSQKSLAWAEAAPSMGEQVFSRREARGIDVSELKRTESEPGDCSTNFGERLAERSAPPETESDGFATMLGLVSGVVLVDARGLVIWANKARGELSRHAAAELRGT